MHEMNILDEKGNKLRHFTQWDQFQKIIIEGMVFVSAPQVHFYNKVSDRSHTMESHLLNQNQITVEVPNDLLTDRLPITISLYFPNSDGNGGKTELHTIIPVKQKAKPENFFYVNNNIVLDGNELNNMIQDCKTATNNAQESISNMENTINSIMPTINEAISNANDAAQRAEEVVNGDISSNTVTFQEATTRANIQSGDSISVALGKLAKLYADLDNHAYYKPVDNLTTTTTGKALDAAMGKVLSDKILKIDTCSAVVESLDINGSVEVPINYSHLGASHVYAIIPYALGGIPMAFSINGLTDNDCKIWIRNDTANKFINRTIKIYVLYT